MIMSILLIWTFSIEIAFDTDIVNFFQEKIILYFFLIDMFFNFN